MTEPAEGIARNSAYALALRLTTGLFTAALTVFLARALGPAEFGLFALAMAVVGTVKLPSDFGISQSAMRFVAERRGRPEEATALLASALRLKLVTVTVFCVALVAVAGPVADAYDEPGLAWALRILAVALFAENVGMLWSGVFTALARTSLSLRVHIVASVTETATSVAIVLVSATATAAAAGRTAGYLAGAVAAGVLMVRLLGPSAVSVRARGTGVRRMVGYAGALLVIDGAYALFQQIDVILIGAYLSASAAGLFQAPIRLVTFLGFPAAALATAVGPRLAVGAGPQRVDAFEASLRYVTIFHALLLPPLVVWAEPLTRLILGSEYLGSAEVLRALTPFVFLSGLATVVSMAVNYLGEARRRIPIAVSALAANVVIDVILIPDIGIVGGAIGTDVAFAIYVPAHLMICRRLLGIDLRPLGVTLVRSLVAAALMAGALVPFGTSEVSVPMLVAGTLLGTLIFAAALLATREITIGELRRLALRLRRL